jgi:hypothetical protein
MEPVDCLAELLLLLRMLDGDKETITRMRKLLFFLMANESYEYNQKTKGN